jgi:hypothetical protein
MKTMQEAEQELLVKEQRVSYWEKFGIVPSMSNLMLFNDANMEVGA